MRINLFKILLVTALFSVGIGLILNADFNQIEQVSADNTLPDLVEIPTYSPINPAPLSQDIKSITLEDVLVKLHGGQWFGWIDSENKIYRNLIVLDEQYSKPSEVMLDSLIASATSLETNIRVAKETREVNRITLETSISNDTASIDDVRAYLRILGGF